MKKIALIDIAEPAPDGEGTSVEVLTVYDTIDPAHFTRHWNNGVQAVADWEVFCQAIYTALREAGLLTDDGFDFEGYDQGSFIRLIVDNKKKIPEAITSSIMGSMVLSAIIGASKFPAMKKGRTIKMDVDKVVATLEPITPVVIARMEANPHRKQSLGSAFDKLLAHIAKTNPQWMPSPN